MLTFESCHVGGRASYLPDNDVFVRGLTTGSGLVSDNVTVEAELLDVSWSTLWSSLFCGVDWGTASSSVSSICTPEES